MHKVNAIRPMLLAAVGLGLAGVARADTVTITLGGAATAAVPLSPSLMVMIAAVLALAGFWTLKNKQKARGLLLALLAVGVAGAGIGFQRPAEANFVPDLTDTHLSTTVNGCQNGGVLLTFQNQSANSVTIVDMVDDGDPNQSTINFGASTCQRNGAVASLATCTIAVSPGRC